jgi:hypothetical protein
MTTKEETRIGELTLEVAHLKAELSDEQATSKKATHDKDIFIKKLNAIEDGMEQLLVESSCL